MRNPLVLLVVSLSTSSLVQSAMASPCQDSGEMVLPKAALGAEYGGRGLRHRTSMEYLPAMFRAGGLLAGKRVKEEGLADLRGAGYQTGNYKSIFLSLYSEKQAGMPLIGEFSTTFSAAGRRPADADLTRAVLIFDLALFNRRDYHATSTEQFGQAFFAGDQVRQDFNGSITLSWKPHEIDRRFFQHVNGGEVVFKEPIPFSLLKEVWVHPSQRSQLIRSLEAESITPPEGTTWETLIVGRENYPQ